MKQKENIAIVAGTVLEGESPSWSFCQHGGDAAWRKKLQVTVSQVISDRTADALVTRTQPGESFLKVGMKLRLRRNKRDVWTYVVYHPEDRLRPARKEVLHLFAGSTLEMRVLEEAATLEEFEKIKQLIKERKPTKALRLCNEYIRARTESNDAILATLKA